MDILFRGLERDVMMAGIHGTESTVKIYVTHSSQ